MRTPDEIHDLDEVLFELGDVFISTMALELILARKIPPIALIGRHVLGDWDKMPKADQKTNKNAVKYGGRVASRFTLPPDDTVIWIMTEADRSRTTVFLPEEY